ncbi:LysE family translocator [Salinifilum aidingensis]
MTIDWGPFLLALLVIVIVPGPDFVLVTSNAATSSRWGWLAAMGVTAGLVLHATAATLGLSALVAAVPAALWVVKGLGVAYLCWMGLRILHNARRTRSGGTVDNAVPPTSGNGAVHAAQTGRAVFLRALLTDVLNPKVMLTFLTLLPQAMDPGAAPMPQAALLSAVAVSAFASWWLVVVPSVQRLSALLAKPRRRRVFERCCGGALLVMAGSIAMG